MTLEEILAIQADTYAKITKLENDLVELKEKFLSENAKYDIGFEFINFDGSLCKIVSRNIYKDLKGSYIVYDYKSKGNDGFLSENMLIEIIAENHKIKDK